MVAANYDWDEIEDNIVEEYDHTGATVAEYTTEPRLYGDLISHRRDVEPRFYHFDGQGSTLALTNASEAVTDTNAFTGFGVLTDTTGSTLNSFEYIGKKGYCTDSDLGEVKIRHRAMVELHGRWTSQDPQMVAETTDMSDHRGHPVFPTVAGRAEEAAFWSNRYAYARNSPLVFVDPSGRKPCRSDCWVEYSRGNDDLDDANYQTAVVRVTLEIDACKCRLRYAIGGSLGQYGPCECTGRVSVVLCYKATAVLSRFPALFLDPMLVHGGLFMRVGTRHVSCGYTQAPGPDEPISGSYYSCCLTLGEYECAGAPYASGRAVIYSPGTWYPWMHGHDYQTIDWGFQIQGCGVIADRSVKVNAIPLPGRRKTDLLRLTSSNCVVGPFASPHPPGRGSR